MGRHVIFIKKFTKLCIAIILVSPKFSPPNFMWSLICQSLTLYTSMVSLLLYIIILINKVDIVIYINVCIYYYVYLLILLAYLIRFV